MKLLYLYIEKYGCIAEQEFNFDSGMQFHYDPKGAHEISIIQRDLLPENFWGGRSVKSVSAIIGNNGSGKTTVARFIADLLTDILCLRDTHFIAVFQRENEPITCIFNFGETCLRHDAFHRDEFEFISLNDYLCKKTLANEGVEHVRNVGDAYGVNLVYHSNHYSPAHEWGTQHVDNSFDLSTTAFLYKDSNVNPIKIQLGSKSSISLDKHKYNEYKRILAFIQRAYSNEGRITEKVKELIPIRIVIWDVAKVYFERSKTRIKKRIRGVVDNGEKVEALTRKLQEFMGEHHHADESFVDFRIGTYIKILLVDACLDNSVPILKLLDCIQERDGGIEQRQLQEEITDFLKRNSYSKHRIPYFIEQISKLREEGQKKEHHGVVVDAYGRVVVECASNLSELLKVFQEESGLFYSSNCFSFQFDPVLSSGEMSCLTIFSRLNDYFLSRNGAREIIVFFDEIEITLEPNLQRRVVSLLMDYLNSFKDYSFHVILASHSPILLSDIPDTNVTFLKKDFKTKCSRCVEHRETGRTFGANIYTLYKNSFFMDKGLMGEFAEQKISRIYEDILLLQANRLLENREKRIKEMREIIAYIGEPVIRSQLAEALDVMQMRTEWEENGRENDSSEY